MRPMYLEHLNTLSKTTTNALEKCHFENLVIYSGSQEYYFADDRHIQFKATPHFAHWCPLNSSDSFVIFKPNHKPVLIHYIPDDYWYDHSQPDHSWWYDCFEVKVLKNIDETANLLKPYLNQKTAWIGPAHKTLCADTQVNPELLTKYLDWQRSFKSVYEIECSDRATAIAAKGHQAAKSAFLQGSSEREIHRAYLDGCQQTDTELPYHSIICLDEKSAILHYEGRRTQKNGKTFLIDAGAMFHTYAADITRTYIYKSPQSAAEELFKQLITSVDTYQKKLCEIARPGLGFAQLQIKSHEFLAQTLIDYNIIQNISVEAAIAEEVTWSFYPHGVGHMLGLQVHDVAGKETHPETPPSTQTTQIIGNSPIYRYLRNKRQIDVGNLFTVEPGIYFIPSLLQKVPATKRAFYNWSLIESLTPLGGIRIEDNIFVDKTTNINITRKYLP